MTQWRQSRGTWSVGEDFYLGNIIVGSAYRSAARPKGDPLIYSASVLLPGIVLNVAHYATHDEAKRVVESAVRAWMRKAAVIEDAAAIAAGSGTAETNKDSAQCEASQSGHRPKGVA